MNKTSKIIIGILVVLVLVLLARYVVFKGSFDKWGNDLERIGTWQDDYKKQHPDATKEETDAAFESGIANLEKWKVEYKQKNPDATDAQIDAAFNAQWKK